MTGDVWAGRRLHPSTSRRRACSFRGRPRAEDRRVVSGMVYKIRTGVSWRVPPERFGPWKTVYTRIRRYAVDGVFTRALRRPADGLRQRDLPPPQHGRTLLRPAERLPGIAPAHGKIDLETDPSVLSLEFYSDV
ncbi:transposase [Streptomyces sp. NPDC049949]|uniref:transposase n=1 Tax=Streptomyces sp. NPDC049949 TaxID=3154627 RepID=UPI003440BA6F